ncbi:hypothetical protein Y032_0161g3392 [Ancylostoma ceylanicum]|uniref:Nudix hydrolase domain-containing protein n=1 Tax=Ancylostoma ceylanicum TaxID=53326 RepID=A0A016SX85_9BILA|nr:hypothetical protein Y032_0161g3392 [Ancylostoma ceylanicum]
MVQSRNLFEKDCLIVVLPARRHKTTHRIRLCPREGLHTIERTSQQRLSAASLHPELPIPTQITNGDNELSTRSPMLMCCQKSSLTLECRQCRRGRQSIVQGSRGLIQHGWKFPGGRANDSEPIFHTAKRKVAEETGITAEPLALIALRHKVLKTYSNIGSFFFFCLMRVKYESGVEEPELPTPPDEFTVWWFTK